MSKARRFIIGHLDGQITAHLCYFHARWSRCGRRCRGGVVAVSRGWRGEETRKLAEWKSPWKKEERGVGETSNPNKRPKRPKKADTPSSGNLHSLVTYIRHPRGLTLFGYPQVLFVFKYQAVQNTYSRSFETYKARGVWSVIQKTQINCRSRIRGCTEYLSEVGVSKYQSLELLSAESMCRVQLFVISSSSSNRLVRH